MTRKATRHAEHRGVSYWPGDSKTKPRIILATEARLIALDAKSGKPALDFGDNGEVNLRAGVADNYPKRIYAIHVASGHLQGSDHSRAFDPGRTEQRTKRRSPSFRREDRETSLAVPC